MQQFITFKDFDNDGKETYYILQRDYPHFCAYIATYPIAETICQVPVTKHHLYITFCGTLRGNFIASYQDAEKEINFVLNNMALWFYANRIEKEPKRYKKWLIT